MEDDYDVITSTIVGNTLDRLADYASELPGGPSPAHSQKEHYEFYAERLQELANNLKTAAYFAMEG